MDPNQPITPGAPLPPQPVGIPQPPTYQPQPTPVQATPAPEQVSPAAPVYQPQQPLPPQPVYGTPMQQPAQSYQPVQSTLPGQPFQQPQPLAQPYYGQAPLNGLPPQSSQPRSKRLVIAGLIALILMVGAAAVVEHVAKGSGSIAKLTTGLHASSDVQDRSDGTLDLSKLIDKQATIKSQDIKAKLNQQVNLSDGTSYMVTAVERNFVSTSDYVKADTGKELIKISLVIGNRSQEGSDYVSSSNFQLRNSAGGLQDTEYVSKSDMVDALDGTDVAPGKQTTGAIVFQVDKDEKVQALVTSDEYQNYKTNATVTIKSEVSLL